jgi:hypothetical protein
MAKTLTAAAVEKLRAGKARREIPDGGCAGLYLQIGTTGAKSWTYRYRRPTSGKPAKLTLGKTDLSGRKPRPVEQLAMGSMLTLAEARALASQVVMALENGRDPGIDRLLEKKARKVEAQTADQRTYPAFARIYVERYAKPHRRDWKDLARLLGLDPDQDGMPIIKDSIADRWQHRAAASITKTEVVEELDRAVKDGRGPTRGNKLLAALKAMWRWHVKRGALESDPCSMLDMPVPVKSLKRNRRLSDDELRCLWGALDDAVEAKEVPSQYAALQRFCCLTLARRDEAREMVGTEVAGNEWIVPAVRMGKSGVDHLVTLSPAAINELPEGRVGKAGFVFSVNGKTPLGSLSKWKRRVDLKMLARLRALAAERGDQAAEARWIEIERLIKLSVDRKAGKADRTAARKQLRREWWQPHDYRRNGRSFLSKVESKDIAERTLAHVIGGVRSHYDLYEYKDEKARALQLWAREVARILSGDGGGKVITMRKRSRS